MNYRSPISPGVSWYEASVAERPSYPPLEGDIRADVAIVGGGYTGLSAALRLADQGTKAVLIDAHRFGDGASGRNGGQLGTGQRAWPTELEGDLGLERSRALFQIAEDAKSELLAMADDHGFDIDYRPGQISAVHKKRWIKGYRNHTEAMAERYDYPHLAFLDREQTAAAIGSERYHASIRDVGTGHIHPLKLVVGLAAAAKRSGAKLYENTPALDIAAENGGIAIRTERGVVHASRCLVATNAHGDAFDAEPVSPRHIMPIRSFVGTTSALPDDNAILPAGEAVDDSRFMVRYFRKTPDNRLMFGGREAYSAKTPNDIAGHIRRQIGEIFPALSKTDIDHVWGGSVGITLPRLPFVRTIMPGVTSIGGFSGHGVMMATHTGRLWADAVTGHRDDLDLLKDLDIPPFPGGTALRKPLLFLAMTWYAMLDRL
ncbi:FAD-binding oxidoreductase [Notoacmeibacter sp. MSK16QG-6]|uniref:NAD(P)/FAD-dependent oxidoreductase n=1 Tax=Notoacmeibacter sp. MSK16QG-6 TaxID=2957982 RepID=UPI0020A01797|nr:FAD-binding oxidoreductase [Notoacmeibacter sp. MSK16QG-6]MCP1198552.1 FAD-binding oxidoreductase [Notoacmeibacter sp. MSK16QG-6]